MTQFRFIIFLMTTVAALMMLFASCSDDDALDPVQFSLSPPAGAPLILRDSLISLSGSYAVGYENGNIRSTRITLKWNKSRDPEFLCFKITRNGNVLTTILSPDSSSYVDQSLTQNTMYRYVLTTINKQGLHTSDTILLKTPSFNPPALNFITLPDTTLRIWWNRTAESATGYRLDRKGPGEGVFSPLVNVTDTMYDDWNVAHSLQYQYRIVAISPYETSSTSPNYTYTVSYSMTAPVLTSITQIPFTRRVQLTWNINSTSATGFKIYRKTGSEAYSLIKTTPPTTSFIDADTSSLLMNTTHSYYIQGFNEQDTTPRSNILNILIRKMEPAITLSTTNIVFPTTLVGNQHSVAVYVFNLGLVPLQVQSITSSSSMFYASPSNFTVPAEGSYNIAVYYSPQDTFSHSAVVSLFHNAAASPTTITVSGKGSSSGDISQGFEAGIPSNWSNISAVPWTISTTSTHSGIYSARSGAIGASSSTALSCTLNITGSKTISFWYRASSESCCDRLTFSINGISYGNWGGETGWQQFTRVHSFSGTAILSWTYSKDGSAISGLDAAFIDDVTIQ